MPAELDGHYRTIARAMASGRLVLFLGAGANLCNLPTNWKWTPEQRTYLPSGRDLARHLASLCQSEDDRSWDLARVAQCIAVTEGDGPLYSELRKLFDADYDLTPLHTFIASRPAVLRAQGCVHGHQLVMTTNYDDLLERAFDAAGEPYDVVTFNARTGFFLHRAPDGSETLIERANEYDKIELDETRNLKRSLIVKLHGTVDRRSDDGDSYVITEDNYIEYLAERKDSELMPNVLRAKLKRSHFLFLGYGLRDWNLRVILHRIWHEQDLRFNSWSVQLDQGPLETKAWSKHNVEILAVPLLEYVKGLAARMAQDATTTTDQSH